MSEINILSALISIALLLYLLFWLYPDYRTDLYRQKMFKLRDELFNEAASGKINFNDPAYGMLRNAINGHIRFAHRSSIWHAFIFLWLVRNEERINHPFESEFDKRITQCTQEQKEIYLKCYIRMIIYFFEHLILSSVALMVMVVPWVILWYKTKLHVEKSTGWLKRRFDKLNTMALETGKA